MVSEVVSVVVVVVAAEVVGGVVVVAAVVVVSVGSVVESEVGSLSTPEDVVGVFSCGAETAWFASAEVIATIVVGGILESTGEL